MTRVAALGYRPERGSIMKKRSSRKKVSAFAKLSAGIEDAIAYHRGERTLTAREVSFRPLPKLGARDVAKVRARLSLPGRLREATQRQPANRPGLGDQRPNAIRRGT